MWVFPQTSAWTVCTRSREEEQQQDTAWTPGFVRLQANAYLDSLHAKTRRREEEQQQDTDWTGEAG